MALSSGVLLGLRTAATGAAHSSSGVLFAALLLLHHARVLPWSVELLFLAAFAVALQRAVRRRVRPPRKASLALLDFELGSLGAVALLALLGWLPGGLRGPFQGALYVSVVLLAALARPSALLATGSLLVLLLLGSARATSSAAALALAPQAVLLALCVLALWLARGRRGERARELAPRDVATPRPSQAPPAPSPTPRPLATAVRTPTLSRAVRRRMSGEQGNAEAPSDPVRARSGLEDLQRSLSAALDLCRITLGCRSVLALCLDATGRWLFVREVSSLESAICSGPFSAAEGVFAASLTSGRVAELVSSAAARQVPYYKVPFPVGHVAAIPLGSGEGAGLLALDRALAEPLTAEQKLVLESAAELVRRTLDIERSVVQLERAKVEQGKLYRAAEQLNEAQSEMQVIQAGVGSAREFAAFHFAAVTLVREGGTHEICAVSGPHTNELVGQTFNDSTGLVGMVVENRHPLPFRGLCDAGYQVVFTRELPSPDLRSLLVLPLLVHQEVLGTLVLGSDEPSAFGSAVRPTLEVLARHIAVSLANARMMKRLEDLATTDGLTGLLNKRAFIDAARQKVRSAVRFQKPLSVLVCDLDHFKAVNDTHGHDVGDRVIRGFADVLRHGKRDTDVVGRFGGEEFVLICEQTDLVGAQQLAERIRMDLANTTFVTPSGSLRVTCSVGIAAFPRAGQDWDELFRATDEALYASKRAGRDRVTVWSPRVAKVS
jgi:two-component system cell cycle response regulator